MVFFFLAAASPRTMGLALTRVDPKARREASRRNSRRVRPSWREMVGALLMGWKGADWRKELIWRNKRTAGLLLFPCRLPPDAPRGVSGKPRILPGRDLSGRCGH